MRDWAEMKLGFKTLKEDYDSKIEELRGSLQKKKAEADARQEGLIHFLWKVCFRKSAALDASSVTCNLTLVT